MTPANRVPRNSALDFTKGALVLFMVLYHWNNYFFGAHDNRYLRFLTPSFIFISGFIVSNIYLSKYGTADPQLPKRLFERGLKILGVFFVLNFTRDALVRFAGQDQSVAAHWTPQSLIDIYVVGNGVGGGQGKAVAFFVLVPIGYLLILSALLVMLFRYFRYVFHLFAALFLIAIGVLYFAGAQSPNLELLAIGLLGVIAGYLPVDRVNSLVRHPFTLCLAYLAYLAAITRWNVRYPLQIIGVYLTLMIIYLVGLKSGEPGTLRGWVILLGKYSLYGYIAQIAILQLLHVALKTLTPPLLLLAVSFVLAFVLTVVSVEILDRLRRRSALLDSAYKAVFA
jgi:hypothetical protein